MKITKLEKPLFLFNELEDLLACYGIEFYDVVVGSDSLKFRAKRAFNKPYAGGGMKLGVSCASLNPSYFGGFERKTKMAKHLHWEEWAVINDIINSICDEHDLGGSFKSWFDGKENWIRRNGEQLWKSPLTREQRADLELEAHANFNKQLRA